MSVLTWRKDKRPLLKSPVLQREPLFRGPDSRYGAWSGVGIKPVMILQRLLPVYTSHHLLRIPEPGCHTFGCNPVQLFQFLSRQLNVQCSRIFLKKADSFGPGYREDLLSLCHYPGQGKLRGSTIFCCGQLFEFINQVKVFLKILSL